MTIKILNAEPDEYTDKARNILNEIGELHEEACNRDRLMEMIPEFDVLIVRLGHCIDSELLDRGKRLKAVVTATTGLNHIDLEAASANGVEVLSLKGEREFLNTITATAELTWGLILSLLRRLPQAYNHVLKGHWNRDQFKGNELRNKTLGIIGCGRLGSIVAEYGRLFRMNVMTFEPYRKDIPEWIGKAPLDEVLKQADIVSLHVNLDENTSGFFGKREFASMKRESLFINTSRGELIDEQALYEAMESGRIGGAALDVLQGEAIGKPDWLTSNLLWKYAQSHDNLILTPHIGGATIESMADTELFMANKLRNYLSAKSWN